jgi:hypothetical protein
MFEHLQLQLLSSEQQQLQLVCLLACSNCTVRVGSVEGRAVNRGVPYVIESVVRGSQSQAALQQLCWALHGHAVVRAVMFLADSGVCFDNIVLAASTSTATIVLAWHVDAKQKSRKLLPVTGSPSGRSA